MTHSMAGRWSPWYSNIPSDAAPQHYGGSAAYEMGAQWLAGCETVEDWGCGLGWARQFFNPDRYVGVDGTESPFSDVVADLLTHKTRVEGIFCRGVLEHNPGWKRLAQNLVRSFTKRAFVAVFTPMAAPGEKSHQIGFTEELGVPDLSLSEDELTAVFGSTLVRSETIRSVTAFGAERLFYLEK